MSTKVASPVQTFAVSPDNDDEEYLLKSLAAPPNATDLFSNLFAKDS